MSDGGLSISSQQVVGTAGAIAGDIRAGERYDSDQYSQVEVTSTQLSGGAVDRPVGARTERWPGHVFGDLLLERR